MKAFKAWAIIWTDGEVVSLHMNRDLACYSTGGDERCVPVEVRPLVKSKKAFGLAMRNGTKRVRPIVKSAGKGRKKK